MYKYKTDLFSDFFDSAFSRSMPLDVYARDSKRLNYDIVYEDGKTVLAVEVPGYTREQISVKANRSEIVVTAKNDKTTKTALFTLTRVAAWKDISSKLENGMLYITVPSVAEERDYNVEIG